MTARDGTALLGAATTAIVVADMAVATSIGVAAAATCSDFRKPIDATASLMDLGFFKTRMN